MARARPASASTSRSCSSAGRLTSTWGARSFRKEHRTCRRSSPPRIGCWPRDSRFGTCSQTAGSPLTSYSRSSQPVGSRTLVRIRNGRRCGGPSSRTSRKAVRAITSYSMQFGGPRQPVMGNRRSKCGLSSQMARVASCATSIASTCLVKNPSWTARERSCQCSPRYPHRLARAQGKHRPRTCAAPTRTSGMSRPGFVTSTGSRHPRTLAQTSASSSCLRCGTGCSTRGSWSGPSGGSSGDAQNRGGRDRSCTNSRRVCSSWRWGHDTLGNPRRLNVDYIGQKLKRRKRLNAI